MGVLDTYPEATPAEEDGPPAEAPRNKVAMGKFPHARVRRCWEDGRLKYAEAAYKDNLRDYLDALQDLCGPNKSEAESEGDQGTKDKKFAGPIFTSDFLKLVSFFNNREPRTTCRPADLDSKPLADATAAISDRSAYETSEKEQDTLVIAEGICRNHGYEYSGWDHYRWLPKFPYVRGELMLDPDCEGDIKAARWAILKTEMPLSDLLDDDEVLPAHKAALRDKQECHRHSRVMKEGAITADDAAKSYAKSEEWDGDAGLEKVPVLKIFSRDGLLPGWNTKEDPEAGNDDADVPDSDKGPLDRIQRGGSPHSVMKPPPEVPEDAAPTAQLFDPQDAGRRVYILMVVGFDKVLKVTDWPMDHLDRDELPFLEFRPIMIPGLLHGMNIYRMIRPYMKIINEAIEFWIASEKRGAKRIIEAEDGLDPTEMAKLESTNLYEVMKVPRRGMMGTVEFAGRLTSFKEMIPFMMKMHDDTTGINEAVSGRAPEVEETASAAKMRQDQAVAAISYLENAVDAFHERKARMRVAALQRYVPKETVYAPCPHCGGTGVMSVSMMGDMPIPEPCQECNGTGNGRILKKGARFWIRKQADAWRDDLSLDEIRAEVVVGIEPGSSRTDYTERQLAIATSIADRYVPLYQGLGLPQRMQAVVDMHIRASGISNPDSLIPTVDEVGKAIQAQQEAMAAQGQQKAGKSPEEIQADIQTKQHEAAMREREVALEERKAQADVALRSQQIEVQHQQVQAQVIAAQIQADCQRENSERQAAPKQPVVDPLKAFEVESKVALEQEKLQLEREKCEAEHAAKQDENAAGQEQQAHSADMAAQMNEQMTAMMEQHEKRMEQTITAAIRGIATAISSGVGEQAAQEQQEASGADGAAKIFKAIEQLKKAMLAPKKIIRDDMGRVSGVEQGTPEGGSAPGADKSKEG